MTVTPVRAWAVVDAVTDTLVVVDGRCPIYWLRRVAQAEANEHGFTTVGRDADVRLCRVVVTSPKASR